MAARVPASAVVVSKTSVGSRDPADIIQSNVSFVNALFTENLRPDEVAADAARSYYVDYYLAEMNNGGFSQFVHNSGFTPVVVKRVREGLRAMGATRHLAHFDTAGEVVKKLGKKRVQEFLASDYFDDAAAIAALNAPNAKFFSIAKREDLTGLNGAWLRQLPNLAAMTIPQMKKEIKRQANALPNRKQRIAAARAEAPGYEKLIRLLCKRAGHKFEEITAGDPTHKYKGRQMLAWYFYTHRGLHYMVEADGKALMFPDDKRKGPVCEVDAPAE